MHLSLSIVFFLLALVGASNANIFARGSESFVRAAAQAHRSAAKRSAGLARDLRLSFRGLLIEQQPSSAITNSRVYCVNSPGLPARNSTTVTGDNSTTGPSPSATGKGGSPASKASTGAQSSPTPTPSSSPWKLKQQYVSDILECFTPFFLICPFSSQQGSSFFNGWDFFTGGDPTNGLVTYIDQATAVRIVTLLTLACV